MPERVGSGYAYHVRQRFVARQLKSPSMAEFPAERHATIRRTSTCSFEINGYADVQSSLGATLRTPHAAHGDRHPAPWVESEVSV